MLGLVNQLLPLLGAGVGGAFGGLPGASLGGSIGGGLGSLSNYLFGGSGSSSNTAPQSYQQASQDAQMQLLRSIAPQQFRPIQFNPQQYIQDFNQNIAPELADRFTALGGQRSSGYLNAMANAESDLASRLAALQMQHNLGQQQAEFQNRGLNLQQLGLLQGNDLGRAQLQQAGGQNTISNILSGVGLLGRGIGGALDIFSGNEALRNMLSSQQLGAAQHAGTLGQQSNFQNTTRAGTPGAVAAYNQARI